MKKGFRRVESARARGIGRSAVCQYEKEQTKLRPEHMRKLISALDARSLEMLDPWIQGLGSCVRKPTAPGPEEPAREDQP